MSRLYKLALVTLLFNGSLASAIRVDVNNTGDFHQNVKATDDAKKSKKANAGGDAAASAGAQGADNVAAEEAAEEQVGCYHGQDLSDVYNQLNSLKREKEAVKAHPEEFPGVDHGVLNREIQKHIDQCQAVAHNLR